MLAHNIEEMLADSRPRLLYLAHRQGIAPDATDDVVQETLLEAWRHLHQLRSPEHFDAWLNGICHNVCLRWKRHQGNIISHQLDLFNTQTGTGAETEFALAEAIPDPTMLEPDEELSRRDMETLLDRALGYLPASARVAIEMCYLAELPQSEAALQLGLTIKALEVRLVRARRQLRQVLSNELKSEAETFGLFVDQDNNMGWQETRIWCMFCGRHHLQGRFETLSDGRVNLLMRCPDCLDHSPCEWIRTGGTFELCGLRSFRPALNRSLRIAANYWTSKIERNRCLWCQAPLPAQLIGNSSESPAWLTPWEGLRFIHECPLCESQYSSYIGGTIWLHPFVQDFIAKHPRWINEPEALVEHANQPAFRVRLTDITSSARLTLMLHRETLEVIASFNA